jgi:hypothetical protein
MNRYPLSGARAAMAAIAVALLAAAVPAAQQKPAQKAVAATTPEAFVTALYRGHFARHQRWDLTYKREQAKFAPELLKLLKEDERKQAASPDEVVGLDFDPITDAQDEATRFKVTGSTSEGEDAIVSVSVYFGTEVHTVRLRLTPSGSSWLIANVLYDEGDLIKILKEPN